MKLKILFLTALRMMAAAASPQSVVITGKKITYTRRKPD